MLDRADPDCVEVDCVELAIGCCGACSVPTCAKVVDASARLELVEFSFSAADCEREIVAPGLSGSSAAQSKTGNEIMQATAAHRKTPRGALFHAPITDLRQNE
jgi:hypothetical protein